MRQVIPIREYESFTCGKQIAGYKALPEHTFEQLENFILANRDSDTDALELMGLSAKKGVGKVITARNYVGVIAMKDGTTIEILPKIYSPDGYDAEQVKRLLIEMLKSLRNAPYKSLQTTNVDIAKMNLFEIFIRMFLDEVLLVVKRGLRCSYETITSNETMFKGKMVFTEQIRHNFAHKERAFVQFDEFNTNRPENRLLKSTLLYLYHQTGSSKNKADIRTLLNVFAEVPPSVDYEGDYAKYVPDRNTKDYSTALLWSRVFLMGKSFTAFSGSEVAQALLFPMETLFESYVAAQMRKVLPLSEYALSAQDKTYHLFRYPTRKFLMKPDIVVTRRADETIFICDTKWKLLSDEKANYGISRPDMYQMYAYQKKYGSKSVTLLYPLTEAAPDRGIFFDSGDGVHVKIRFVDLLNVKTSLTEIAEEFRGSSLEMEAGPDS